MKRLFVVAGVLLAGLLVNGCRSNAPSGYPPGYGYAPYPAYPAYTTSPSPVVYGSAGDPCSPQVPAGAVTQPMPVTPGPAATVAPAPAGTVRTLEPTRAAAR